MPNPEDAFGFGSGGVLSGEELNKNKLVPGGEDNGCRALWRRGFLPVAGGGGGSAKTLALGD